MRKTKIVCTLGPATESPEMIKKLIIAGMDVARLNFSYGKEVYHGTLIKTVKTISRDLEKVVAILQDLAGPKIRIGKLPNPVTLHQGDVILLTGQKKSDKRKISISHPHVLEYLTEGDVLYLADGSIKLRVIKTDDGEVTTEVLEGGVLSSYKGVNLPNIPFEIDPITEKDKKDLKFGLEKGVDWVAMSFVRAGKDVKELKDIMEEYDREAPVIAKIEKSEAVDNLKEILKVADGIMVARGDLGVEIPLEEIPVVQKRAIKMANKIGKPVITATQMMKSMVVQPHPTRAEVTDIANAVLDGTDAVMLSEETAMGRYPVEAVRMMDRTIRRAENIFPYLEQHTPEDTTESIAYSAAILSMELDIDAIISFTRTGTSAFQISRYRPPVPILIAAHDEITLRKFSLVWGCIPLISIPADRNFENVVADIVKEGLRKGIIREDGDIIIISGFPFGVPGTTNTIKVLKVPEALNRTI